MSTEKRLCTQYEFDLFPIFFDLWLAESMRTVWRKSSIFACKSLLPREDCRVQRKTRQFTVQLDLMSLLKALSTLGVLRVITLVVVELVEPLLCVV